MPRRSSGSQGSRSQGIAARALTAAARIRADRSLSAATSPTGGSAGLNGPQVSSDCSAARRTSSSRSLTVASRPSRIVCTSTGPAFPCAVAMRTSACKAGIRTLGWRSFRARINAAVAERAASGAEPPRTASPPTTPRASAAAARTSVSRSLSAAIRGGAARPGSFAAAISSRTASTRSRGLPDSSRWATVTAGCRRSHIVRADHDTTPQQATAMISPRMPVWNRRAFRDRAVSAAGAGGCSVLMVLRP